MMCLSFSESFFTGDGEVDLYDMPTSVRPTNLYQAAISLSCKEQVEIAKYVFGFDDYAAKFYAESEDFGIAIVDRCRETDCCDGCVSPIRVYIDEDCYYWLTVY